MRRSASAETEVLVIGHGAAGLLCASSLASMGKEVMVVGKGATATSLSTGCLCHPWPVKGGRKRGTATTDTAEFGFDSQIYSSEYSEAMRTAMADMAQFLVPRLERQGLSMEGGWDCGTEMMTNIGTSYAAALAPSFTFKGRMNRIRRKKVALLGVMGDKDFDSDLARSMISELGHLDQARAYWIQLAGFEGRRDVLPSEIALRGRSEGLEDELVAAIADLDEDYVGVPPLFSLANHETKMSRIERCSGRKIFEIVTPLSLPGLRLQHALEMMATGEGCNLRIGGEAIELAFSRRRAVSAIIRGRYREHRVDFECVVIATGGIVGGGLAIDDTEVKEPMGHFQIDYSYHQSSGSRFASPIVMRALSEGARVDRTMRLHSKEGERLDNAYGAGAFLAGSSFGAGGGLLQTLATSWIASRNVLEVI